MIAMVYQSFHGAEAIKANMILKCNVLERLSLIGVNHGAMVQKDQLLAKHNPISIKMLDAQKKRLQDNRLKVNLNHDMKEDYQTKENRTIDFKRDNKNLL